MAKENKVSRIDTFVECECGSIWFMLKLNSGDQTTATHLVCAECDGRVPLEFDSGFEISIE